MENKPYRSLNAYYREVFGRKTAKISLDGGFTCPNRDGKCGTRGCLFCSAGGSGDFAENAALSITEQIENGKAQTADKWKDPAYVAYFQAFTNTYAPVEELRRKYEEALACDGVEGISIATRADCLPEDVLDLLEELNGKTKLWVELGLQTADETSAEYIRRGYPLSVFEKAVNDLAERHIPVIVHVILGLPGENRETLLHTIDCVNRLPIQGIKLQLLHVLSDSDLAEIYEAGEYIPLTKEEYIALVGDCIAHLREDIIIHRLTGDGDKNTLLAPLWSLRKRDVLNSIHKYLKENGIRQGMYCKID
ncbi:TIGR01212 family radical SAM protein [Anaerotignum sp.]|nr:TIGR01212 family radical SAM protein [Anaerotignum sp.]MBQ7758251.1 TIGR01212 family radical SAM protein [Anaerotignum sp.]